MYNAMIFNDEIFKDITSFKIKPIYQISNHGTVINKITGQLISFQITDDGYARVSLQTTDGCAKQFLVHRLVMMAFHPIDNPEEFQVNHLFGNKLDNRDNMLEWTTNKENCQHAFQTGLNNNIRENHVKAKLTNDIVENICKYLSEGLSVNEIIDIIGETECLDIGREIRSIREGKSWKTISDNYTFIYRNDRNKFSDSEVELICNMLENGIGYKEILTNIGIDVNLLDTEELFNYCDIISNIRTSRYYSDISRKFNFDTGKDRYDQTFSNNEIHQICSKLQSGADTESILLEFGIIKEDDPTRYAKCKKFISRLKNRKIFINISKDYSF